MRLNDPYVNYIIISAYKGGDIDLDNRLAMSKLQDKLIYRDFNVLEINF